jgi:hypothetical protein
MMNMSLRSGERIVRRQGIGAHHCGEVRSSTGVELAITSPICGTHDDAGAFGDDMIF